MGTPSASDQITTESLREDYQLKVTYLTEHFNRMWTRFSFMLSVQLALFGVLGYFLFDKDNHNVSAALLPIVLGLITALLWLLIGVEDRFLVQAYRDSLVLAFDKLRKQVSAHITWAEDDYVGFHCGQGKWLCRRDWLSWYFSPVSITTLPAWIPLLTLVLWIVVFSLWLQKSRVVLGNIGAPLPRLAASDASGEQFDAVEICGAHAKNI